MSDVVIRVENLGKKYRIQHQRQQQRYVALRDVIAHRAKSLFRNSQLSTVNFQLSEDFWALKDVSFEVKQGEVVGIIGRNGAGKSTLLKILSRITEPTQGKVGLLGHVASLLEVGTGFHPELTGRENIYLNGAILGMAKADIKSRFDEIVAFAEIETFLDTPVKRYSSGMYMRLAFAVAAHLEPEILVVDEVLAVGDLQFQKKCLGKMKDVAKDGRTVLFVSHNMAAVKALCTQAMCLSQGQLIFQGPVDNVIASYIQSTTSQALDVKDFARQNGDITIEKLLLMSSTQLPPGHVCKPDPIQFRLNFKLAKTMKGLRVGYSLNNSSGVQVNCSANTVPDSNRTVEAGSHIVECTIQTDSLHPGDYSLSLAFDRPPYTEQILRIPDAFLVHVEGQLNPIEGGAAELKPRWTLESIGQN